jgi:hypothetical protein
VGLLNLDGPDSERLIAGDAAFLTAIFGSVRSVDLAEPSCDVLFLYARLEDDGSIAGSPLGLREIIRDTGARIVVFGLPNSPASYGEAHHYKRRPYGLANLVETLDRRGDAFEHYLTGIFLAMKRGLSMCTAHAAV